MIEDTYKITDDVTINDLLDDPEICAPSHDGATCVFVHLYNKGVPMVVTTCEYGSLVTAAYKYTAKAGKVYPHVTILATGELRLWDNRKVLQAEFKRGCKILEQRG